VENSIIARLRDRLATAKTANEMFRVFSKFNALFVRPKIRGAIQEYQTQLIENVKTDIASAAREVQAAVRPQRSPRHGADKGPPSYFRRNYLGEAD